MYYIIEVANTHAGSIDYVNNLIERFACFQGGFGMKFQPFRYDSISTRDHSFYEKYKEMYFDEKQWSQIISKASETKDVWLDLFDCYGVEILRKNLDCVKGIKFQSSVLYNYEVFTALETVDLSDTMVILNIAAQSIEDIGQILERINKTLNPREILLEFGYQGYPTSLEFSGISKIEVLKRNFKNRLVFADHVDGQSEEAILLPFFASGLGIHILEKHVMLEDRETKYDAFSSLTFERYKRMVDLIDSYHSLLDKPFINSKEQAYLDKSIMIPILKKAKKAGELINLQEDFVYRRSGKIGLNTKEIEALISNYYILTTDKEQGATLVAEDFKKATIATVVACRLKSTRLPRKALLCIGNLPSVERCIKNSLLYRNVNHTVLATSFLEDDAELKNHTYSDNVLFFAGDPEDVIKRYIEAVEPLKADIIIRKTADCPFPSPEILDILLKQHFLAGADYTAARKSAVGTASEIMNVSALKKIKAYFPQAAYSEYMTWYFKNNPEFFRLNLVDLPESLVRDYRLILDYQEDLDMFNCIQNYLDENKVKYSIENIFEFLDAHPEISSINSHLTLKYRTDQQLIDTLNRETKMH